MQVSTSCCVHLFDTTGAMRKTVSLLRTEKDFQSNLLRHQISLRRIFVLGDHKKRFLWSDFFREVKKCQVSFYRSFVTHASLCYHKTGMLFNTFCQYLYGLSCSLKVEELKKTRKKRFPMNRLPLCLTFFASKLFRFSLFLSLLTDPCLEA